MPRIWSFVFYVITFTLLANPVWADCEVYRNLEGRTWVDGTCMETPLGERWWPHPLWGEGGPLTIVEAAATGCVPVAFDIIGPADGHTHATCCNGNRARTYKGVDLLVGSGCNLNRPACRDVRIVHIRPNLRGILDGYESKQQVVSYHVACVRRADGHSDGSSAACNRHRDSNHGGADP